MQFVDPKPATRPDGQILQLVRSAEAWVPGAHFWHAACPFTVTSPSVHFVHFVRPPGLAHRSGHATHTRAEVPVRKVTFSYFPGTQAEQNSCRPSSLVTIPSPQCVQPELPVLAMNQSEGHSAHAVACVWSANFPSVHGAHAIAPLVPLKNPRSQSTHSVAFPPPNFPSGHVIVFDAT